jgi:hypothetical protein
MSTQGLNSPSEDIAKFIYGFSQAQDARTLDIHVENLDMKGTAGAVYLVLS